MSSRIIFTLSIVLLLLVSRSEVKASNEIEARASISAAEQNLVSAYNALLEAEKDGANVTSLAEQMTVAGANLTLAHVRLQEKDYGETVAFAENCRQAAENLEAQASVLRDSASVVARLSLWTGVLAWLSSVGIVASATIFSWRVFKKRYYRRVLSMKPEEVPDES